MNIKSLLASFLIAFTASVVSAQEAATVTGKPITINVLGQVNKSSRFTMPTGGTILDALATAGDATKIANLSQVKLIHKTNAEKPDVVVIDVKKILNGTDKDITLRDGDTIYVGESFL